MQVKKLLLFLFLVSSFTLKASIENLVNNTFNPMGIGSMPLSTTLLVPSSSGVFDGLESHLAYQNRMSLTYQHQFPNAIGIEPLTGNDLRGALSFETGLGPYLGVGVSVKYQSFNDESRDSFNETIGNFFSWQSVVHLSFRIQNVSDDLDEKDQNLVNRKLAKIKNLKKRLDQYHYQHSLVLPFPISIGLGSSLLYEIFNQSLKTKSENLSYLESILFHASLESEPIRHFKLAATIRNIGINGLSYSNAIPWQFRGAVAFTFSEIPLDFGMALEFETSGTNNNSIGTSLSLAKEFLAESKTTQSLSIPTYKEANSKAQILRLGTQVKYRTDLAFQNPLQLACLLYGDWGQPENYLRLSYGIGYSLLGGIDQRLSLGYQFKPPAHYVKRN